MLVLATASIAGCGPWDPLERIRLAQDVNGEPAATVEPLRELLEERPDDPELHYRYGIALIASGQPGLATWPLHRAMESPEWRERAVSPLVSALLAAGDNDDAIAVCTRFLEQKPDHVPTLLLRAQVRMRGRGDFEATLADAERVLELEPDNHDALVPRAVALLGLERIDEAAAALEQLEALYRDESLGLEGSPGFCVASASFAQEKGDAKLAEQRYEHCLAAFSGDPLVLEAAVSFFDNSEEGERSLELLREALARAPESQSLRLTLALRLRAQGQAADAEALLREGTQRARPEQVAEAWATMAAFQLEAGDFAAAADAFAKARELDVTRSPQLVLGLADALLSAERYDEALALADEMKLPAHREVVRGRVALARGDPSAALKHFEEGLRLWPDSAVARYYAGVSAEQSGDFERAAGEYRYAMRIDVNATDAYLRLARIHAAAHRDDLALWALRFSAGARPDELDAALLEVRVLARGGRTKRPPAVLLHRLKEAERWGAAVAALGRGIRERSGPAASLKAMRAVEPLDLREPAQADALEAIVEDLAATKRPAEGLALVDAGLRRHPDAAVFHALRARALALTGAASEAVRAPFQRALELEPNNLRALLGLARLERDAGSLAAAWALYEKALAVDPHDPETARDAAKLQVALEHPRKAEELLDELLREHPHDGVAARELAELRLARGAQDDRTRELARRAVAFDGGDAAKALLERVSPQTAKPAQPEAG